MEIEKAKLLLQRVRAGIEMLKNIEKDLQEFVGEEAPPMQISETFLGDDGKEYLLSQPYIKSKQWYCCGKPLKNEIKDGKQVFHCDKCNSYYSA